MDVVILVYFSNNDFVILIFINCSDKDNKAMADKIAHENAERQKKEEEMANRLKEAQQVNKN